MRRSTSSVSNSGSLENSIERCWTPNRNFCKDQTIYHFCQTENSKSCDKLEESLTKPSGTDCPSDDQRGCWKLNDPWFKSGRELLFLLSKNKFHLGFNALLEFNSIYIQTNSNWFSASKIIEDAGDSKTILDDKAPSNIDDITLIIKSAKRKRFSISYCKVFGCRKILSNLRSLLKESNKQ